MRKWFFKRKAPVARNADMDALSARVAGLIVFWQRQLADYLNARCAGLSVQWRIGLLTGFCMLIGAYLLYVLCCAIFN